MSGDRRGTLWTLLVTFCIVILKCTETFWSSCISCTCLSGRLENRVIQKSIPDFRPPRYSSRNGHAKVEHVNRGRDTPSFCPTLQVLLPHTCNVCGRNLITGLTSTASPSVVPPHPVYQPAASSVHYTTSCKQSSAPEDGRNYRLKHVELIGIINKPLLLHLVGFFIIVAVMHGHKNIKFIFILYLCTRLITTATGWQPICI